MTMTTNTKHKKRGSTLSLVIMLLLLVALTAAIILWPTEAEAQPTEKAVPSQQDDVAATTLIHEGDLAPDFTVKMLNGDKYTLSALRGKVVLVSFWATWCPPCRQELAHLQEGVIDKFAGKELVVLPISRGEERATVEAFMHKMKYKFNVGLDANQSIYRLYATNYIPRTFVVDREGKVCYVAVGYDATIAEEVNAAIAKALK